MCRFCVQRLESVFVICFIGYALGSIKVKGLSLGTAGVFLFALLFGYLCTLPGVKEIPVLGKMYMADTSDSKIASFKFISNIGLVMFVTSVGFIAGPSFFHNLKANAKSYVLLGLVVIVSGGLTCWVIAKISGMDASLAVGLLSGALTSTPGFAAAKAAAGAAKESLVAVGNGVAYPFGVIGVVLFVQLVPKVMKADMDLERSKLVVKEEKAETKKTFTGTLLKLDDHGFGVFALAAVLGTIVGKIKIPLSSAGLEGTCFSLTTTGGCLLVALILGHFGRIGKLSVMPDQHTLKLFRELGLVLFLVGAGIPGGADFVANFDIMYFVYGVIMTIVPLIIGYFVAKYIVKLSLLNNLGSITGGMTSTPALGTLIATAGTEEVAAAYAATYPIALIAVVLVSQFLIIFFS